MLERDFQAGLIKEIKHRLPNAIVMKTDPTYKQGIPDLLILNGPNWGALEVKRSSTASKRVNQDYYVNSMNKMSFASFISPENKEEVLNGLQSALESNGTSCLSRSK